MTEILPHSGIITSNEHILPVRVYYEDTDAQGVVYYANYMRYLERGRTDMLRMMGLDQREMLAFEQPEDVQFVVRRCELDYHLPAHLDDVLMIHTRIASVGGASLVMTQDVRRDEEILVGAVVKAAVIGQDGKPKRLPKELKQRMNAVINTG